VPHFVVTYVHPDRAGWEQHLDTHIRWLIEQVNTGSLRASGPSKRADEVRSALLIFNAPNEKTVREIVDTDPYIQHGQVSDLTITEWDPIFGEFAKESSGADKQIIEKLKKLAK
jgi:uncharacterized protein